MADSRAHRRSTRLVCELLEDRCVPAQFRGLGDLPGGEFYSYATAVSADGTVVVGVGVSADGDEAVRWTSEGISPLGDLPRGVHNSVPWGVSADGSVVVGTARTLVASGLFTIPEGFVWTVAGGMRSLSGSSAAYGISANGTVIVGAPSPAGFRVARWTNPGSEAQWSSIPPEALSDFPGGSDLAKASAVSADGSVVVGFGRTALGMSAALWRAGSPIPVDLGDLPGGGTPFSNALGVSADGNVVVGTGISASGIEAFRWTPIVGETGGMIGLGDLPGGRFDSQASAVSGDGRVVVGFSHSHSETGELFIWDEQHGMRPLRNVLENEYGLGTALAGWELSYASGLSHDGNVIVGSGINPAGQNEAWIADLRTPVDLRMLSAQLQSGNTVQFTYGTTGNVESFEVGLYRSTNGVTYDAADRIGDLQTVMPTNPLVPGTFTLSTPWNPDPGKPYLVVVADPNDLISESNPDNNTVSLQLPDIEAVSLDWNDVPKPTDVVYEVAFTYRVVNPGLSPNTSVVLYWTQGGTIAAEAFRIPAAREAGTYIEHVALASLAPAPEGVTRLVLIADPPSQAKSAGEILEAREDNNVRVLPLYKTKDSTVVIPDAIGGKLDVVASEYYRTTGKVLVITDGGRTPLDQAGRILDTILTARPTIEEGLLYAQDLYGGGKTIKEILAVFDPTKSYDENLQAMTDKITDQVNRKHPRYVSDHLLNNAVDVRSEGMSKDDRKAFEDIVRRLTGHKPKDETDRLVGPHFHLSL